MTTSQIASSRRPRDATTNQLTSEREHRHGLLHRFAISTTGRATSPTPRAERAYLLQRAQPALSGPIDGSLSSLAPIFSVALATHTPRYAFYAGLATAIGAGVSRSFSEGLSDTGEDTGRGNPRVRGAITGAGTFTGGFLHTLPFLIPSYTTAVVVAILVVMFELATLAFLRMRFFKNELRHLAAQCRARRCDHRRSERSARVGRQLTDRQLHPSSRRTQMTPLKHAHSAPLAVIASEDGDYERFNLARDAVAPWEDGARTDNRRGTYEWWFFDSHLDDGSSLVVVFMNKDLAAPNDPLTPTGSAAIFTPTGSTPRSRRSRSTSPSSVRRLRGVLRPATCSSAPNVTSSSHGGLSPPRCRDRHLSRRRRGPRDGRRRISRPQLGPTSASRRSSMTGTGRVGRPARTP
ncbi:MAG: hypothetical protein M3065_14410 [Actinomycetota bacterium]|nr:hypothetical protein [Actinomycetota bacterium]